MSNRTRVAIVFGGRSAEHEVSLRSARNVIDAIDRTKYDPILIGIDRHGTWYLNDASLPLLEEENPKAIRLNQSSVEITLVPRQGRGEMVHVGSEGKTDEIDVVFPVLHGPYGEDGSVQGLAKLANLPCVGSGILGSAVAMDKDVSKRLLKAAGLAVTDYVVLRGAGIDHKTADAIGAQLGLPLFVKPANLGSSVGIERAFDATELIAAVASASEYDTKVLIEKSIVGREIECAVLGNEEPIASIAGEIETADRFYSYDAKYLDENGAVLRIPAELSGDELRKVQDTAIRSFKALECSGMARVDMFLTGDGDIYVNEVNTIPGFTRISMYPKLWEASGMTYAELVDRLIVLAINEHESKSALRVTRE